MPALTISKARLRSAPSGPDRRRVFFFPIALSDRAFRFLAPLEGQ